eukprot:1802312-Rhodomonas_salina.1
MLAAATSRQVCSPPPPPPPPPIVCRVPAQKRGPGSQRDGGGKMRTDLGGSSWDAVREERRGGVRIWKEREEGEGRKKESEEGGPQVVSDHPQPATTKFTIPTPPPPLPVGPMMIRPANLFSTPRRSFPPPPHGSDQSRQLPPSSNPLFCFSPCAAASHASITPAKLRLHTLLNPTSAPQNPT